MPRERAQVLRELQGLVSAGFWQAIVEHLLGHELMQAYLAELRQQGEIASDSNLVDTDGLSEVADWLMTLPEDASLNQLAIKTDDALRLLDVLRQRPLDASVTRSEVSSIVANAYRLKNDEHTRQLQATAEAMGRTLEQYIEDMSRITGSDTWLAHYLEGVPTWADDASSRRDRLDVDAASPSDPENP